MDAGQTWIAGLVGLLSLSMVMNVLCSAGDGDEFERKRKVQVCGNHGQSKHKARSQDDLLPDLDGISLAEVGFGLKSHLLAPRASQQRRWKTLV